MMDGFIKAVAARLSDGRCPALLQVADAQDGAQAMEMLALSAEKVSALVSPGGDVASPIRDIALRTTQNEDWTFLVTMGLVYPGGFDQWEPARNEILAALRGWSHDDFRKPVEYAGGQTTQYTIGKEGGRWLHVLRFKAFFSTTYEVQE